MPNRIKFNLGIGIILVIVALFFGLSDLSLGDTAGIYADRARQKMGGQ